MLLLNQIFKLTKQPDKLRWNIMDVLHDLVHEIFFASFKKLIPLTITASSWDLSN